MTPVPAIVVEELTVKFLLLVTEDPKVHDVPPSVSAPAPGALIVVPAA